MGKSGKNIINFTSFNSSLGKNEIFSQDDDISGFKCYISFFKNYKKNNKKFLNFDLLIFILGQFLICLFKTISLFNHILTNFYLKLIL